MAYQVGPYTWFGKTSESPGKKAGWYSGTQFITTDWKDPTTGKIYTETGLSALLQAPIAEPTTPITEPTSTTVPIGAGTKESQIFYEGKPIGATPAEFSTMSQKEQEAWIKENYGIDVSGQAWGYAPYMSPEQIATIPARPEAPTATAALPTFGEISVPAPAVTPAPAYEISPEQKAWEEAYRGKLTKWLEAEGIPKETQTQMIQAQTDVIKAQETENIRVMRNNMERRGITNSGFIFSNEQNIRSNTTVTIANSIRDVQIKSALMKMSSFEKAMGATGQFLGYLSEQSQLKYQPQFATWQAEQMATMQKWQAKVDIYKMQINQAYQQQNMQLQAQLNAEAAAQQHTWDVQMAEMEIEVQQQAADATGTGQLIGNVIGAVATIAAASILK